MQWDGSRLREKLCGPLRMECTSISWGIRVTSLFAPAMDRTMRAWWRSRKSTTQRTCCGSTKTSSQIAPRIAKRLGRCHWTEWSAPWNLFLKTMSFVRITQSNGLVRCGKKWPGIVYSVSNGPPQLRDLSFSAISANPATIRIDNSELRNLQTSAVFKEAMRFTGLEVQT